MIEISGKYCKDLKIFTNNIESVALDTLSEIVDMCSYSGKKIRIMPDCHQGKGMSVIGFTSTIFDRDFEAVSPDSIGCDIGCGVSLVLFDKQLNKDQYALFEHRVRKAIPTGKDTHEKRQFDVKEFLKFFNKEMNSLCMSSKGIVDNYKEWKTEKDIEQWCKSVGLEPAVFYKSIQTAGGGNHFLEYDENPEEKKYGVSIHTGSRNIGLKVYNKHAKKAKNTTYDKKALKEAIEELKKNFGGNKSELPVLIDKLRKEYEEKYDKGFLQGEDLSMYLYDVAVAQIYAKWNHMCIIKAVSEIMYKLTGGKQTEVITSMHNYIDYMDGIVRKGAIRSHNGEKLIIPFNMRDGIAVCEGKSNEDWNCSAPHGAGRAMSRTIAKTAISMDTFKSQMEGIYSTSVVPSVIDEAPDAYKEKDEIVSLIEPTCDVLYFMIPKINIKAITEERYW